jgi:hypothetical protein
LGLFDAAALEMDAFGAGERSASQTAARIYQIVEDSGLWPKPWGKEGVRGRSPGVFTIANLVPMVVWIKTRAPKALRENYFKRFQLQDVLKLAVTDWASDLTNAGASIATLTRDFAFGYNRDWTRVEAD